MIAHIEGTVLKKGDRFAVIAVGGLGYKVFVTGDTLKNLVISSPTSLWTHHIVREDADDLYGFENEKGLRFFELLISVSSIGPKTALNILSVASIQSLERAITSGETAHLVKVSGVGRKTAEKIVLELREKLGALEEDTEGESMKEEMDALEALKALGYSHSDARDTLKKIPKNITGTSDRIKTALKMLGK